jgi:NTE family protein
MGRWTLDTSPAYVFMDLMSRVLSPYALNPLDFNALRRVLAESVDCPGRFRELLDAAITNASLDVRRRSSNFISSSPAS